MKIGDLVEVAWSLPMYAPPYNGKRGVISGLSSERLIVDVTFDRADGSQIRLPIPNDCLRVVTLLDVLAEV